MISTEIYPILYGQAVGNIYSNLAALTALTYDILISLETEVAVIWSTKWTFPKAFYLGCRYLGLLGMIVTIMEVIGTPLSDHYCKVTVYGRYIVLAASALCVEAILLTRIYALYKGNKPIFGLTGILILALGGASAVLLFMFLFALRTKDVGDSKITSTLATMNSEFVFPGCFTADNAKASTTESLSKFFWIPLLIFESYMFLLTLIKFFQSVRGHRSENMGMLEGRTSLFITFYRDGTIYFAIIFVCLLFKVIVANLNTSILLQSVVSGWTPVIFSIAGPRLVLNLRSANKEEEEEQRESGSHPLPDIESNFVAATNPAHTSLTTSVEYSRDTECRT